MPIVLDVSQVAEGTVSVQYSPVADMMALLHVFAEPGHHRDRGVMMQSVHSMLSSRMSELLDEFSPLWARYRARFMMPLSTSTHSDLIAELRAVEEMDLGDFTMLAAEAIHGNRSNWTELLRQEDVRQTFLEHAENASPERAQLAHRLVENPRRFRERLLAFLAEFGCGILPGLRPDGNLALEAELESTARLVEKEELHTVLTRVSPLATYLPQAGQIVFDKLQNAFVNLRSQQLVLVPSIWSSPHTVIKYESTYSSTLRDLPVVVQYPVSVSQSPYSESAGTIMRRLAILADGSRTQLCRNLLNGEYTTSELARRTSMSSQQVSRHLSHLRDAGLVISTRDGRFVRHRLAISKIYALGTDFISSIVR